MLGLVLLYWIGKYFYKLAEEYDKKKWSITILGIAVYYGGVFIFGFIAAILAEVFSPGYLDAFNDTLLGVIMLPFGVLSCYLLYRYLEKKWLKEIPTNELEEIGR